MIVVVIVAAIIIALALGIYLCWYRIWQWEEVYLGKKIYQIGQGWLMYIGDMDGYGAMYYDGKRSMKFYMRGMWHTYKTIDDNETIMHLKGMYVYGFVWPAMWKIWSKGKEDAASVVRAAKRDVDSHAGNAGA